VHFVQGALSFETLSGKNTTQTPTAFCNVLGLNIFVLMCCLIVPVIRIMSMQNAFVKAYFSPAMQQLLCCFSVNYFLIALVL